MNTNQASPSVQEFSIRVPKSTKKKFHVMRFSSISNVDFMKWGQVKMERENNIKEYKTFEEEQPKYGAGSEYGREAREEARRKKFGIITRKYKPEDQPWILKIGGKTGKKFKGIREGGVAENASYYVFTHAADGGIEAYPLTEWYNFQPIQRYKALSAEEAEQEFGRRNKVMNYFSLMLRKRLKNDEDGDGEEGEENKTKKGKNANDLKISEMDDWIDSDDDDDRSSDEEGVAEKKENNDKKKKKVTPNTKTKKKRGSDESAVEESDDGDEEGRELDYISDSSESESDHDAKAVKEMKGVAEESALRRLLTSDEDEDEENEEKKEENKDSKEEGKDSNTPDANTTKEGKGKKKKKKKSVNEKRKADADSSSDSSGADSSDSDNDKMKENASSRSSSRCPSPSEKKSEPPAAKKSRLDTIQAPLLSYGGENGITEEAVRRYLMRKPMTATELLQKFKSRKTGLSSDQLVNVMTQILKKINPVKQTIQNKMYFSIKPT
ncbi:transcription factor IIFalpha [Rhodnius prolixus]|uniref:transcription factor IIFalpha n=1 Tax=Rhodnius prolixus TaxID=13249 RepID=UPI003D189E07